MFEIYLQELIEAIKQGNATEHTHRATLQKLLKSLDDGLTVTNEPKRIDCGAPDFLIQKGYQEIGHIEAKDVGKSLKREEKSQQMKRYLAALGNLILTDYLDFRWYLDSTLQAEGSLGKFNKKGEFTGDPEGQKQVESILKSFLAARVTQAKNPKDLAKRMAGLAQLIRETIATKLKNAKSGVLFDQYKSFQQVLIRDLTKADFADMYAQTICYGLFAARCNTKTPQDFSRKTAGYELPKTNPFLRDIFDKIAGIDLDESIAWAVDILANILKFTDMAAILEDFGKRTRREDPVVHFYETFLAAYDPKMRKSRGVYYTPEPVVSYMVRSVDYILKEKFGIRDGLASKNKIKIPDPKDPKQEIESHQVLILDPAVGTGTFLHGVIDHIYESFKNKKGMWSSYVGKHLLPRLFGFELLMAPYTVAHMKLGLQLQELGYEFDTDERLKIFLINTLQEAFQIPQASGLMTRIKDEAEAAKEVKQERPVMVVLGNPPYSYKSKNTDPWIINLVRDYYLVDGESLGERNPRALQDDYVKFIRFAQHRIQETGYGIVAFITNHGYLDNPTCRGMRQHLMQTFDEVYSLDLHGNQKRKEIAPDGSHDDNIFDIETGVSIVFCLKYRQSNQQRANLYCADLYGVRESNDNQSSAIGKYNWLAINELKSTQWEKVFPRRQELYLFYYFRTPIEIRDEFLTLNLLTEVFKENSVGLYTARDPLAIQFNEEECFGNISRFLELSVNQARDEFSLGKDSRDWKINLAQQDLNRNQFSQDLITNIAYRPFDVRKTVYTGTSRGFHCMPRSEIMHHFITGENFALTVLRRPRNNVSDNFFVTNTITDKCIISSLDNAFIFPLYLYPSDQPTLFDTASNDSPGGRRPNLEINIIDRLREILNLEFISDGKGDQRTSFAPEDVFNYIYALLYSPTYRERYAECLKKLDFPRVPFTKNIELFWSLVNFGDELIQIHLMNRQLDTITGFPIDGDNIIEKITYTEPTPDHNGRVYINKTQYIDNVPPDIYNFYIGGYQVCNKWLKDRKGREFTDDDFEHYSQIVVILKRTKELMAEIDSAIEKHGGFPIQ